MQFIEDIEFQAKPVERKGGPKGPRARSDEQKPWDEAFKNAYDLGRPFAVQLKPADANNAKKRVNSAARYLRLAVTEGVPQPGMEEGTVVLVWKIRVPVKRNRDSAE